MSKAAEKRLLAHEWPGNIRELKNAMEAAVALAKNDKIDAGELRIEGAVNQNYLVSQIFAQARQEFERIFFQSHYEACGGHITEWRAEPAWIASSFTKTLRVWDRFKDSGGLNRQQDILYRFCYTLFTKLTHIFGESQI